MLQLLRKIAFPFSLIYALVVFVRNSLYDVGLFKSISYKTPTICVGNLSVGGTGKTPMIEYLIRLLENSNIAVLSRGYKRKSKGFLLANEKSTVEDLGDEPFQIHKKFPQTSVAVDADRRNGIAKLESLLKPDIILLDDAFQHRKVKPKFSILLTAYDNLFVKDWYLPTGDLRDSKLEAKRADIIMVTKCPQILSEEERRKISSIIRPTSSQLLLFCSLEYSSKVKNDSGKNLDLIELKNKNVALVTGIANPKPLVSHLGSTGLKFQHFEYGDHHYFSGQEIARFKNFEIVLTTEKDYVRLEGKVENLYYLEIAHRFNERDALILRQKVLELV
ncbi:tetraacyldisaccharide 4'-kinase [Flagellimonas pacifica]|uniref:Tetraacyldisaccharide 4'-kinase n=1 Tax=Flagellimonas pacifica TaxID=1247520 RepID=A0A285MXL2_9FLAO|nr:tetraacyldisaccharide 4'-kinase [Allomuricauda parva]SNZ01922.1 lipid-A-disaccharide kinase [Allomuricauda parva]